MLGKLIAKGNTRHVYELKSDRSLVIKVAITSTGKLHNKYEHIIWNYANDEMRDWLVPVVEYHDKYLIMERGQQLEYKPKEYPIWLCNDTMAANWVLHKNKEKLCDYGNINIMHWFKLI